MARRRRKKKKQKKLNRGLMIVLVALGVLLVGGGAVALVNPRNVWNLTLNKFFPRDPSQVVKEALAREKEGDYEKALATFGRAIGHCRDDEDKQLRVRVEFAAFLKRRIENAENLTVEKFREYDGLRVRHLDTILRIDPEHIESQEFLADRAWTNARRSDAADWWKLAVDKLSALIELDKTRARSYWRRAIAHESLLHAGGKHATTANADFAQAASLDSTNLKYYFDWVAFLTLPTVAAPRGQVEKVFEIGIKANPGSGRMLAKRAEYLYRLRDAGADVQCQLALAAAEKSGDVDDLLAAGRLHLLAVRGGKERDFDAAAAMFKKATVANPARPEPYQELAGLYRQRGMSADALVLLKEALRNIEAERGGKAVAELGVEKRRAYILRLAAVHSELAYLRLRELPKEGPEREAGIKAAQANVDVVVKYMPKSFMALKPKGLLALAEKRIEDAVAILYKAHKLLPSSSPDPQVAYPLVCLYMRKGLQGELGVAQAILRDLAKASPNNPMVLMTMGRLRMIYQDYEVAKKCLDEASKHDLPEEQRMELARLDRILRDKTTQSGPSITSIPENITPRDIPTLLREARRRRLIRKTADAIAIYKAVIAQHPDNVVAVAELVQTYSAANDLILAARTLTEGLKTNPNSETLKLIKVMMAAEPEERQKVALQYIQENATGVDRELKLATYYRGQRDVDKYIAHLAAAVKLDPSVPGVLERLFIEYVKRGQYDKADALTAVAREHGLGEGKGLIITARLALGRKQWVEAAEILQGAIRERGQFSMAHALLGDAYRGMGKTGDAKDCYNTAYEQNPTNLVALIGLAHLAELSGGDHMKWVTQAHKYGPRHPYVQSRWLQSRLMEEDPSRLIGEFQSRFEDNPRDVSALMVLMELYERVSPPRLELARDIRTRLYKLYHGKPNSLLYLKQLVDFLRRSGKGDMDAITTLDLAVVTESDKVGVHILYEQHLREMQRPEEAMKQLRKALAIGPKDARAHRAMASWAVSAGNADQAVESIARFVELQKNSRAARRIEADVLLSIDRVDEAGKRLDTLLKEAPGDVATKALRGRAYQLGGDVAMALKLYEQVLAANARNYHVRLWRAPVFIAQGRIDDGIDDLAAANRYHGSPETADRLARILLQNGRGVEAMKVLDKAVAINPRSVRLMLTLGGVLVRARDWHGLQELTARGRQIDGSEPGWDRLDADWKLATGDLRARAALLGRARQLDRSRTNKAPDSRWTLIYIDALLSAKLNDEAINVAAQARASKELSENEKLHVAAMAARAEIAKGRQDAGQQMFRKMLPNCQGGEMVMVGSELRNAVGKQNYRSLLQTWARQDDQWPIWAALAVEYLQTGEHAEAREPIRQALRAAEGEGRFLLLRYSGEVEKVLGDPKASEAAYRAALKMKPEDGRLLNNLASLLAEDLKRPADGLAIAKKAVGVLKGRGDLCEAYDTLGWVYFLLGRAQDAERELSRSAQLRATPANRYHMGRVLEKLGQPKDAQRQYSLGFKMVETKVDDPSYELLRERCESLRQR